MKAKKVLIFSFAYYPRLIGGAEVAVKEITDRIQPSDIVFDMITLRKDAPSFERIGNVNVYRVGFPWVSTNNNSKFLRIFKYPYILLAFLKATRLHKKNNYDAIWSIMANYAGFAALLFKSKNPKVPFLLTLQEGDLPGYIRARVGIFYPVFKKIFAKADRIQTISNFLTDWARSLGAKCAIDVVPNGVDFESFSKVISTTQRKEIRRAFGFTDSDIVVITTGRLVLKNAVDVVLRAMSLLGPSYKFLSLGDGADLEKLNDLSKSLGLENRVVFNKFVSHSELPPYLQASDIFVRPSRSEGLGNSFLEAMAAGIPVVATRVGGIPDFITDGETGLFCEVDNPNNLAQKIEKLAKDRESRSYIVEKSKKLVKDRYTWQPIAESIKKILVSMS